VWARLRSLMSGLFRRDRIEGEMDAEIRAHLDARTSDLKRRGMDPAAAARQARLEFGSIERYRDEIRTARGLHLIDEIRGDLLCGWRGLRRSPAFVAAACLSLALGIGANTLVFSIVDGTLLRSLPLPDSDRLVTIWTVADPTRPDRLGTSSISRFVAIRDLARSFESVAAYNGAACGVKTLGFGDNSAPPERILGQTVSPSMFRTLGVEPMIGRTFTETEDQVDQVAPVMLLSYRSWQRRFAANRRIVGTTVPLDGQAITVIGVMPQSFDLFGDQVEFFLPLCLTRAQVESRVGGNTVIARLKPGVSIPEAQAEVDAIGARLATSDPPRHRGLASRLEPLQRSQMRVMSGTAVQPFSDYTPMVVMLQGAVGFILLIACANVAGLLLARTASRRHEVVVRHALGATRRRITRQLITETVPLAIVGGLLGVVLARGGLAAFTAMAPPQFPRLDSLAVDARVLAFTAAIVVATTFLFAIVPSLQASRFGLARDLGDRGRAATEGPQRHRARRLLVISQVALSLILLVGAGLMIRSVIGVLDNDLGSDPTGVLTFDFRLAPRDTFRQVGLYRNSGLFAVNPVAGDQFERVLDRLHATPGVIAAAAVNVPPLGGNGFAMPFRIDGRPDPPNLPLTETGAPSLPTVEYVAITRGYFEVMRIALRSGRDFDHRDTAVAPFVVIINEAMARQYFSGQDPLGEHLSFDFLPDEVPRQIVGVVADTLADPLQTSPVPTVYVPHLQQTTHFVGPFVYMRIGMYFVVRTTGEPLALLPTIKQAVATVAPTTPLANARTLEQTLDDHVRNLRLYASVLTLFGVAAVLLAAIGIYGVVAQSVADRTREIGIRMALGARVRDVVAMIAVYALRAIVPGLLLGVLGALALVRFIQGSLFQVTARDPLTYVAVTALLVVVAALACLIPARRAAVVSTTIALKHE
jgi:putative ABC transport system permease protein